MDWAGKLLAISFTSSLALTLIEYTKYGWGSPLIIASSVTTLVSLALFIFVEKRATHPTLPLQFFKSEQFSVATASGLLINVAAYGQLFLLPLYFSRIKHFNITQIGFAILPYLALVSLGAYLSGKATAQLGPKRPIIIGLSAGTLGFVGLLLTTQPAIHYYWMILPLAIIGLGMSFAMPALTYSAVHSAPEGRSGIASSTFTTSRQLGSLIGVTALGSLVVSSSSFLTGFHLTLAIAAGLFFIGLILNLLLRKN